MPCVPFSSRFCTRRAPAYNVRPWVSVDRRMGDCQPLREAVYMRNRRALAGPIRSGDGGGEWRYLSAASAAGLSFLRTPAYNTRPWISVDRQMGAFQSLPEAVRRRDRRALLASIRFCLVGIWEVLKDTLRAHDVPFCWKYPVVPSPNSQ